jgi:hypothetical protein
VIPGFAAQEVYEDGKLFYPNINVAGVTDDGVSFLVHEIGVGSATNEYTQLVSLPSAFRFLFLASILARLWETFENSCKPWMEVDD